MRQQGLYLDEALRKRLAECYYAWAARRVNAREGFAAGLHPISLIGALQWVFVSSAPVKFIELIASMA